MSIDLHLHTTFSDGSLTPRELLIKAKKMNFTTVSITDHDTVDGLDQTLKISKDYNIEVIPGIEFNTEYKGIDVHILGYFIDYYNQDLLNILKKIRKERSERIEKMLELLKELYNFDIEFEHIKKISSNNLYGRSHIARILTEKGYVKSWERVFNKYIAKGRPAYVNRDKITPFLAVDIIKAAQGIPIIAHPGLLEDKVIIDQLISYGVFGLEVYYPEHTDQQTQYFKEYAKRNNLLITGGSDCHGPKNKDGLRLGKIRLEEYYLDRLKEYREYLNESNIKKDLLF